MSPDLTRNESPKSTEKYPQGENYLQQEYVAKPTFAQKAKRHCARFWWIHLIVFCLVFLLIALLLVYVGMPRIAQDQVSDATLEILDSSFTNPTSDSITISQKAILHNPSTFTPTLDAFPAELYLVTDGQYGSAPMLTLPMPRIHAGKGGTNASIENATSQIQNLDQVAAYTVAVISNENVTTALVGKTKLHLGSLPTQHVTFNSTSTYKGLNALKGFNTTDLLIDLSAEAGTPNLAGNAQIPNPSLMTVYMGNVTLDLSTAAKGVVGNATITDFTLVPGHNTLPMTAIIDQPLVLGSLNSEGKVNMTITGRSAVYNGQHLTYYEKALAANVLTLEMNVKQILADSAAAALANSTSS